MIEAMFYEKVSNNFTNCRLCPHKCNIASDKSGLCGVRHNTNGTLYAESYGQVSSLALDPIEKKPLKMFHPGSMILSVGSYGCNLKCPFCQNHSISMQKPDIEYISPEKLMEYALHLKDSGNIGIAYTYNEPLIGYEYVYDCAKLAYKSGIKNVLVTNGYISNEALKELLPFIDAMNIDLKCFSDYFYKELGGSLDPVKNTISVSNCHIEVTTLIVPGKNDGEEEMHAAASWLSGINKKIPLHITRFFPKYKMSGYPSTKAETVYKLRDIALKYLDNVFI